MPLVDLALEAAAGPILPPARAFLREADRRIGPLLFRGRFPAFVPCDFAAAYRALAGLAGTNLARGPVFCEWGSGFGVVTGLAALLGFDACGIEAEGPLV